MPGPTPVKAALPPPATVVMKPVTVSMARTLELPVSAKYSVDASGVTTIPPGRLIPATQLSPSPEPGVPVRRRVGAPFAMRVASGSIEMR